MRIPFVLDNERHRLADVLAELLRDHHGRSLDVATAYFTVSGFGLLAEGLSGLGNFRLLLGAEPLTGEQVGLRPDVQVTRRLLRRDLEALPFDERTLRLVEDLIAYLRRDSVGVRLHQDGFLHAKAWIFYSDRPGQQELFDRFRPVLAVVGSSNFTAPGLTSNRELNLVHRVLLDPEDATDPEAQQTVRWLTEQRPSEAISAENRQLLKSEVGARAILDLERWFDGQWGRAADFKDELIALLDASKFGAREYTPYEVYLKALYEYFKDQLDADQPVETRTAVELAEFQEDAVRKARSILARYDGVMIADSVGLGKTWIGKRLLEDYAYHLRQKALVICPASLKPMWERELLSATIAGEVRTQEELGRPEFESRGLEDADIVLVDESHNFRNPGSQRYQALERILQAGGGRGRAGARKKVILLTATPINNDLIDLYNQLQLITANDRAYFAGAGIGDLYRYFQRARRSRRGEESIAIFNLLEEIVVRRTRPFIREAYPEATIRGERIHFPERRLRTVRYDLEAVYAGIYDEVVSGIEQLKLAPYNLESYKKRGVAVDDFEKGRETALVGIFKSRYLKRFESSVDAFRISIRRALEFLKTFESLVLDGRVLRSTDFQRAVLALDSEREEGDDTPRSRADELESSDEAQLVLAGMEQVDPSQFDLRRLHDAVQEDIELLQGIWHRVRDLSPDRDAKLARLKGLLASGDLRGKKVLIFTYFKDTARYLYRQLGHPDEAAARAFRESLGGVQIRRIDSGADRRERARLIEEFAPIANGKSELAGTEREIQILISTDVLAEGQNLQDCGHLINYDLHWNPTRMVQRAGRIDRIGSPFEELQVLNMFPDEGLERLLRLVERLAEKIDEIDRAGFHDASILGEAVHPQNFNTLRRIGDEDASVLAEEEVFAELPSSEYLARQLATHLGAHGADQLEELPDGIHSGLERRGARGVFFYFQARPKEGPPLHFWRYVDFLRGDEVEDNRLLIAQKIVCAPDTTRVIDPAIEAKIFDAQGRVIQHILEAVRRQRALEEAPRAIDPAQQSAIAALQRWMSHPAVDRARTMALIRVLQQPLRRSSLAPLRKAVEQLRRSTDPMAALADLENLLSDGATAESIPSATDPRPGELQREDLRLICFDLVCGG
jgi:superfamily II DNA or RNA helicase